MLIKKGEYITINLNNFDILSIKQEQDSIWTVVAVKITEVPYIKGILWWRKTLYDSRYVVHIIKKCRNREEALALYDEINKAWSDGKTVFTLTSP